MPLHWIFQQIKYRLNTYDHKIARFRACRISYYRKSFWKDYNRDDGLGSIQNLDKKKEFNTTFYGEWRNLLLINCKKLDFNKYK